MRRFVGKSGFSLMEVMFAVAILATGLVFVACQFPVGLLTCKDVLDESSHGINVHNAQTLLELDLDYNGFTFDTRFPVVDPGRFHLMPKPNVLADKDPVTERWILVVDDLEFTFNLPILGGNPANPADLYNLYDAAGLLFRCPFWTEAQPVMGYRNITDIYLGDIGAMVMPTVDKSDPEVEAYMRRNRYIPTHPLYFEKLNDKICEEALARRYSWASMYLQENPMTVEPEAFTQYMFTLQNPDKRVRYAVQYPPSFVYNRVGEPDIDPLFNDQPVDFPRPVMPTDNHWYDPDFRFSDRLFPAPWRVALDDITTGGGLLVHQHVYDVDPLTLLPTGFGETHFYYDHATGARAMDSTGTYEIPPPSRFTVNGWIGVLLRPGSIIIDADPVDIYWNYQKTQPPPAGGKLWDRTLDGCGYIYEVQDVEALNPQLDPRDPLARYMVTLKTPLVNDMVYCWIFPPAFKRDSPTYEFEDQQPVINVTKKRLK